MKFNEDKEIKRAIVLKVEEMDSLIALRDIRQKWDDKYQALEDEKDKLIQQANREFLVLHKQVWRELFARFKIDVETAVKEKIYSLNWSWIKKGGFVVFIEKYTEEELLSSTNEEREKEHKIPEIGEMH